MAETTASPSIGRRNIAIPDEIHRRLKARAALQGRALAEVAQEALEQWLASRADVPEPAGSTAAAQTE